MIRFIFRALLLGAFFFVSLTAQLYAQGNFVYVNNGGSPNHSVSGYMVAASGALTEITGSPFLTGGDGSAVSSTIDNMVIAPVGNFLYVPNGKSGTITVFTINSQTGFLAQAPGSPFPIGVPISEITLAVTRDNRFLYAAETHFGTIVAFRIDLDGSLTQVPGSPFHLGDHVRITVSPDGKFLFTLSLVNRRLAVYRIGADGGLTFVPDSRIVPGDEERGDPYAMEVNCASNRLFIGERAYGLTRVEVWNIAANGTLTAVPGSVFEFFGGSDAEAISLSPDERHLFVGNIDNAKLTALNVAADGSLSSVPGSPFYIGSSANEDRRPVDLTTNQAGTLLFVANADDTTGVFRIAADGVLSEIAGSPFPAHHGYGATIVAFPPKHCGPSYDTCLQDDSNGNLLQINSTTGEYRFSNCRGVVIAGTGSLSRKGSRFTLQHTASNLRLLANLDTSTHRATASVQSLTSGTTFTISDRDTTNNSCACSN